MQQPPPNSKSLSASDRSARSVFVGNISYEVTEEQLRQTFAKVGPVVHFRLVYDRETGKPKGFGFCEYVDVKAAETAQRALNGMELNGRNIRVDSATGGERSADEVQQFQITMATVQEESPYGPEPEQGKAPEAIARSVASMPPERMFELMRQMKETVLSNPTMARQLLVDNPQLAYALLQAQVVMRVVDPKVAYSMLHREQPASLTPFHQQPGVAVQSGSVPATVVGPPQVGSAPTMGFSMPPPTMAQPPTVPQPPQSFVHPAPAGFARPPLAQMCGGPPPFNPPPVHVVPPQQQQQQNDADEEQHAQMLVKLMQLTDDQINMLPPDDRAKVLQLRNQLRQQVPS